LVPISAGLSTIEELFDQNITTPSKAIDINHAPLARCGGEGIFVTLDGVGLTFNQ